MPTFQTAEGQPPVEITGVGMADHNGIDLERAAQSMSELQKPELDENDEPTGERIPLTGSDLLAAAKEWAGRAGLIVVDDPEPDTDAEPEPDTEPDTEPTKASQQGTGASAAAPDPAPAVVFTPADPGVNAPLEG